MSTLPVSLNLMYIDAQTTTITVDIISADTVQTVPYTVYQYTMYIIFIAIYIIETPHINAPLNTKFVHAITMTTSH